MVYSTLSTEEPTNTFNAAFGKNIKKGSYTRAKVIADLEAAAPTTDPTPAADDSVEVHLNAGRCPLCGGDPSSQTAGGAEGTFLGDSCQFCHECGQTYNLFDGSLIPAEGPKKKRRIINPQAKINAKADALREAGMELFYDRPQRIWAVIDSDGALVLHMSSREFAQYSVKEFADYCATRKPEVQA